MGRKKYKRLNRYGRSWGETFTDGAARLLAGRGYRHARCLVVLSTGRVGTDTLAHLLDLSPGVRAYHEPRPLLVAERLDAYHHIDEDPDRFARIFIEARSRRLASAWLAGKLYAETSARLTFFAPVIAEMLPQARFLFLHRHPGDVVRSGMRRGWYDHHPNDAFRLYPGDDDPVRSEWDAWDPFTKICWYWHAYNDFSLRFVRHIDPLRVMSLRSEQLFDASSGAASQIFDFIGEPAPPQEQIETQLASRHNAQSMRDFPRFDAWSDQQKQTLYRIAGRTMCDLGYPVDPGVREGSCGITQD